VEPVGLAGPGGGEAHPDTTYLCVVDKLGNGFSATPSDGSFTAPVVPGLGTVVSARGSQSWLVRGHPSALEPWKRPRLTPNPGMVLKDGRLHMVFGSPGGDVQTQAMLQVLINYATFGMDVQAAVDAPRFFTASFPSSFYPHGYTPGLLNVEGELADLAGSLAERGHRVGIWGKRPWRGGGVCAIVLDAERRCIVAAADPRRECSAMAQ
jgi:gamma-glutamyltranspeptidase/glutathione hydrolase